MASKNNNRHNSPIKGKNQANANASRSQYDQQHDNDYSAMLNERDVVRGLSEREVEIDHLRTTVIALKEQVSVSINFEYLPPKALLKNHPDIKMTFIEIGSE
jgi:hypothetical protein